MEPVTGLILLLAVSWACGLNLYATVLTLGVLAANGLLALPPGLQFLSDPTVLSLAAFMYCLEFLADKTPGIDSGWDAVHTFVRIPAGAVLAMLIVSGAPLPLFAGLMALTLGGGMAALSHFTKAGARLVINTSPEPVSNWLASLGEDVIVVLGLLAAVYHPLLFMVALMLFVAFALWLLPHLWQAGRHIFTELGIWSARQRGPSGVGPQPPRLPKP